MVKINVHDYQLITNYTEIDRQTPWRPCGRMDDRTISDYGGKGQSEDGTWSIKLISDPFIGKRTGLTEDLSGWRTTKCE